MHSIGVYKVDWIVVGVAVAVVENEFANSTVKYVDQTEASRFSQGFSAFVIESRPAFHIFAKPGINIATPQRYSYAYHWLEQLDFRGTILCP